MKRSLDVVVDLDDPESRRRLTDPAFRESLYRELHPKAAAQHVRLLRECFALEHAYRRDHEDGDYFENLYWCALLLYRIGDPADVANMWRAKRTNMDTGVGFDAQFFVGAGVQETLDYVHRLDDPDAAEILEYLEGHEKMGSFSDLDEWLERRVAYYDAD